MLDRSWAIVHPSWKQSQPPPILCSAFGQPHCWCQRRPSGFPSQTIATFHRFPLGIAQAICHRSEKPPLATFGATFLERQKLKNFGQILKNASFGHKKAKFGQFCIFWGCGLPNSAAILQRPVPHVGFCLEMSICGLKKLKKGRSLQKTLREYFGFAAAILRKILKGQNPSPNSPDCIFQCFQCASEVLQVLSPLTATNLFVLAAW